MQYDILIKNATIIDGTNSKGYRSNIVIKSGKIIKIGEIIDENKCEQIINAEKKYVCPGFIDINNSSDHYLTLLSNPSCANFIRQGITTIIGGHCGTSLAPLIKNQLSSFDPWINTNNFNVNWKTLKDFFIYLENKKLGVNFGTLVGWNVIRTGLIGENFKNLTDFELKQLIILVKQSLKEGALGVSFGLGYPSGRAISKREVLAIAKELKKQNYLFSFHLRDEANSFLNAFNEVYDIIKDQKLNTLISHLKVQGKNNFDDFKVALKKINEINQDINSFLHFDIYPYNYICQSLYNLLPDWLTIGGISAIKNNLNDKLIIKKLIKDLKTNRDLYKNLLIVDIDPQLKIFKNKTFGQVAQNMNITIEEALIKVLNLTQKQIIVLNQSLSISNIDIGIKNQYSIIATNGISFDYLKTNIGFCHQRSVGSFPKYLSAYQKTIPFETLIYKITGLPKEKLNLQTKGLIKINYDADITIINPQSIADLSTIQNPLTEPKGIETVIINGKIAYNKGFIINKNAGQIIR